MGKLTCAAIAALLLAGCADEGPACDKTVSACAAAYKSASRVCDRMYECSTIECPDGQDSCTAVEAKRACMDDIAADLCRAGNCADRSYEADAEFESCVAARQECDALTACPI